MISVTYIVKGFSAFKAFRSNQYNKQQIPTPPKKHASDRQHFSSKFSLYKQLT
jgi:hypothetical protein